MRTLIVVALSILTMAALPALAQVDDRQTAKAAYETGVRHFDLSEFEQALVDFKEAYRNKPDPVFLYNIGQCHRKLGHIDDAITFYQTYLRRAPDAKNKEEVEHRITELESLRDAQNMLATNSIQGKSQASPTSAVAQDPAIAQTGATPLAAPAIDFSARERSAPTPGSTIYSRWWFWTAIGAVAAGAATVAVVMATHDPTKVPNSNLGSQRALP